MSNRRKLLCPHTGKVIFWNEIAAHKVVKFFSLRKAYKVYVCKHCSFFHLASKKKT